MNAYQTSAILKIQRLRALAEDARKRGGADGVNEAAAAAAAAERLIQEHQIAEAEIEVTLDAPDEPATLETFDELGNRFPLWQSWLLMSLEKAHKCSGYQSTLANGKQVWKMAGRPSDVATVRYLYAWLVAEITRLTEASELKGLRNRNSFRLGAVKGIRESMLAVQTATRAKATGAALVRIDARLDAAKALLPANLRTESAGRATVNGDAYRAGQRAGAGIHAGQALGGGSHRLLGR